MATFGRDCMDCPFMVATKALIAPFCGWAPTPHLLLPWRVRKKPCELRRGLGHMASGVEQARSWANIAMNLAELETYQFRGVRLGQVCVECQGSGLSPSTPRTMPPWRRACLGCGGKGFLGDRDRSRVNGQAIRPLSLPALTARRWKEFEDAARISGG